MIRQLESLSLICNPGPWPNHAEEPYGITIEAKGWELLRELSDKDDESRQAFVAMWFSDDMQTYYDNAIRPALIDAGFDPVRIDSKEHNNKICDEIVAEIRKSRFVVADFSGGRGGVYFEAGFALGLGKPVIYTVREADLADVHFDTRQYNHIVYRSEADLRVSLVNRVRATIPIDRKR
jgi:hypothetical protein